MEKSIHFTMTPQELQGFIVDAVGTAFDLKSNREQKQQSANPNQRITRKQVKAEYGLSYNKQHDLMNAGELPFSKVGKRTFFRRGDIEDYFESKKTVL